MKDLTIPQAAERAGVSVFVLRAWLKDGLPHYRLGSPGTRGRIWIKAADLDAYRERFRVVVEREGRKAPRAATRAPEKKYVHLQIR